MKLGIISPRILIRRALSTFLASTGAALVVVEGSGLLESLEEIKNSQAEVLILDVCGRDVADLPDPIQHGLKLKIVVLMDDFDDEYYSRAFQLGIWGCLSTKQSPADFQRALSSVARGERWMLRPEPHRTVGDTSSRENPIEKAPEELTPREWEVLGLIANGYRNKEISARLIISEETAKSHIKSIYRKLNIKGRRDAIFRYFEFVHTPVERDALKSGRFAEETSAPINRSKN